MGSRSGGEETTPRPTGDTEAVAQDFAAYRERMARAERRHRRDALVDQAVGVVIGRSGCGSAEAGAPPAARAPRPGGAPPPGAPRPRGGAGRARAPTPPG